MKKRPKQHQLEDLSRAKFQLHLPQEWVIRDKDKDYGIDCEVELFDSNENSTGLLFYVQLKATSSKTPAEIYSVDFKISTLKYFKQLEIPVLLVRYSEFLDKIFVKWVNDVDLSFSKKNAKTLRINISKNCEWLSSTSFDIENDIRNLKILNSGNFKFPLVYSIGMIDNQILKGSNNQLKIKIRNELNKYSDYLEFTANRANSLFDIYLSEDILTVKPFLKQGACMHGFSNRYDNSSTENLAKDILLSFCRCLAMVRKPDYCGELFFENNLQNKILENEDILFDILPILISGAYFEKCLLLMAEVLKTTENYYSYYSVFANILLKSKTINNSKILLIEGFFKEQLQVQKDRGNFYSIAAAHYNLANFYRGKGYFQKSISHFNQAKKFDENYKKKHYFYHELAGTCFLIGKFYFSAVFYQKSIELGSSTSNLCLLADALMFSGNYEKAIEHYEKYVAQAEKPIEEFILKSIIFKNVVDKWNIKNQKRNPYKTNDPLNELMSSSQIEKALNIDLLNPLAWFNYGNNESKKDNFESSALCFAMCSCINLRDIESWVFAFVSSFNLGNEFGFYLSYLILRTAYYVNQDEFLIKLYDLVKTNGLMDSGIIQYIERSIESIEFLKNDSVVRISGENAEFEEFKLNS